MKKNGAEHVIENKLSNTEKGREYLNKLYDGKLLHIHNQLPNGLFNIPSDGVPHEENRIFTTGFFDIWGIDDKNNLCIFELKKDTGNSHLGIISELFFYAVYAQKILCNKNIIHSKRKIVNYRGYDILYDAVQDDKIKKVRAFFLVGNELYKLIKENEKNILNLLNTNKFNIEFELIKYDINMINEIPITDIVQQ